MAKKLLIDTDLLVDYLRELPAAVSYLESLKDDLVTSAIVVAELHTGQLRISGVQVRIVEVALEHALLQAVRHRHVRDAAVVGEHAPMTAKPIAALHVLGRPGIQQLAEAQSRDKDPGAVDLPALDLDPFDRIPGVVDFHTLAGLELACRDGRFAVLRELMTWTPPAPTASVVPD